MTDLQSVLELATDGVRRPDLARPALALARRRRVRNRGAVGAVLAVAAVTCVVVGPRLIGGPHPVREPTDTPSPTHSSADSAEALTQPAWDPRTVDELPAAAGDVAAGLPEVIRPPASAPSLADQPIESAVVSVAADTCLLLLATDGSWRSVPPGVLGGSVQLTADGTRLAVQTTEGVDVWELATGTRSSIPLPPRYRPWGDLVWDWVDRSTLLLDSHHGGWLVSADTGEVQSRTDYPTNPAYWWTIDPAGDVVESADFEQPDVLTDWAGGQPRRLDMSEIGRLATPAANSDTVVGTTYENRPFSVMVADRADLRLRAVLPITDPESDYGNGGLSVAALLDDGTVLLRVGAFGRTLGWRLVAWEPGTGELSLVSSSGTSPVVVTSLATGLLD